MADDRYNGDDDVDVEATATDYAARFPYDNPVATRDIYKLLGLHIEVNLKFHAERKERERTRNEYERKERDAG
jgi:hypothetical protein